MSRHTGVLDLPARLHAVADVLLALLSIAYLRE